MMKKSTEKANVQVWLGRKGWWVLWALVLFTFSAGIGYGQVGGTFDLTWSTIDGGGGTASTGGSLALGGNIGQPDAGRQSGGTIALDGGFWGGAGGPPAPTPAVTATSTTASTATSTSTSIATETATATATATATSATTPTLTSTNTPTNTPTGTSTPTPLPIVVINEIDSDQTGGNDRTEFIELYDGGVGNTSLTGRVVVFYNGANDRSYAAFDLDGYSTDGAGYFTLGNQLVPGVDLEFPRNLLQNGADAVALYNGDAAQFPNGTPLTTANLLDAVVYDTGDPDDPGLLALLNPGQPQVNENALGTGTTVSIGRCPNGAGGTRNTNTYLPRSPSPDGPNSCP